MFSTIDDGAPNGGIARVDDQWLLLTVFCARLQGTGTCSEQGGTNGW